MARMRVICNFTSSPARSIQYSDMVTQRLNNSVLYGSRIWISPQPFLFQQSVDVTELFLHSICHFGRSTRILQSIFDASFSCFVFIFSTPLILFRELENANGNVFLLLLLLLRYIPLATSQGFAVLFIPPNSPKLLNKNSKEPALWKYVKNITDSDIFFFIETGCAHLGNYSFHTSSACTNGLYHAFVFFLLILFHTYE